MSAPRSSNSPNLTQTILWSLLTSVSLCCAFQSAAQQTVNPPAQPKPIIRERSHIRFVTKQMNVPVEGQFRSFHGTVTFNPVNPSGTRADFSVDTGSIDLHNEEGETEAKRKAWLDVSGFPVARFTATSVKAFGNNKFEATGKLTLKGVSADVVAPFTVTDANRLRTVEGQFPLKRLQFKVGEGPWSDTDTVADEVLVRFRFTINLD
jgi:polyisoprenoid-binding protein YceI